MTQIVNDVYFGCRKTVMAQSKTLSHFNAKLRLLSAGFWLFLTAVSSMIRMGS